MKTYEDGFREGAEQMREAAARVVEHDTVDESGEMDLDELLPAFAARIRSLLPTDGR